MLLAYKKKYRIMKVDESSMGKYAGQNIRAHASEEGRQMWCIQQRCAREQRAGEVRHLALIQQGHVQAVLAPYPRLICEHTGIQRKGVKRCLHL